jgi:hypothetical protein
MQTQTQTQTQNYWTATAVATLPVPKRKVTLYNDEDGSVYIGEVNQDGQKHGQGKLKTGIYMFGCMTNGDNSHLMKYSEYSGTWCNGLLHGHGVMRNMSADGDNQVVFDGMWDNGVPVKVWEDGVQSKHVGLF